MGKQVPVPALAQWDAEAQSPKVVANPVATKGAATANLPGAKQIPLPELAARHHDKRAREQISALERQEGGRLALGTRLWAEIPAVVTESASIDDGSTTLLTTSPNVTGYVTITSFVAHVPEGSTGTLALGSHTVFLDAGTTTATGLNIQLSQSDTRSLTITQQATPTDWRTSLVLCGHVSPMDAQLPLEG
jgi:hypothetical protein